ncbi:MAG: ATP-binding protein [Bacteroidota bacterium]
MQITQVADLFIPNHLKDNSYDYWRARILSFVHLFLLLCSILLFLVTVLFLPENNFPFFLVIPTIGLLIFIFKKHGSFLISGNLISGLGAFSLAPLTLEQGGLYSDNFLWMLVVPLLAFLLASRRSGIVWSLLLFAFHGLLYHLEINHYYDHSQYFDTYTPSYYSVAIFSLFATILGIILIFELGQHRIIKELKFQKQQAEIHRKAIYEKSLKLKKIEKLLRSKNKELEEFAYATSHDLKQPSRTIRSFIELLERHLGRQGQIDERTMEFIDFIKDASLNMTNLVEDIMAYSKLNHDESTSFKPVNLNDVLNVVRQNLSQQIKETGATLHCDPFPEEIQGIRTKLIQLFQNLISNAIKFQKKDVAPIVYVRVKKQSDHFLKIAIEDNGIGISKKYHEKIFELFIRLHNKQDYQGTGIGLASCKKIVTQHNGDIWVDSVEGEGTTFHFTIDCRKKPAKGAKEVQLALPS